MSLVSITKKWEITIFKADLVTAEVVLISQVKEPPEVGGQIIRAAEARAEGLSWSVDVVDKSAVVTAHLGAPSGRWQLLGRLVRVRESRDGGSSWSPLATGRLSNLTQLDSVGAYKLTVSDERYMERRKSIFTDGGTCRIWPPGIMSTWRGTRDIYGDGHGYFKATWNTAWTRIELKPPRDGAVLPRAIMDTLKEDLIAQPFRLKPEGNFKTAKLRLDGVDYPIVTFDNASDGVLAQTPKVDTFLESIGQIQADKPAKIFVWIYAPSGVPAPANGTYYMARIWAPSHIPTANLPLHVGVLDQIDGVTHKWGYSDPIKLWRQILIECGSRYNAAAFTALEGKYSPRFWRITDSAVAADWVDAQLAAPLLLVPVINADGEIVPVPIGLPSNDPTDPQYFDFNTALDITGATARGPNHPSWAHTLDNMVNVVEYQYEVIEDLTLFRNTVDAFGLQLPDFASYPLDLLWVNPDPKGDTRTIRRVHDNVAAQGEHAITVSMLGVPGPGELGFNADPRLVVSGGTSLLDQICDRHSHELFERFGDGPQTGTIDGMAALEAVLPGQFVKMNLASWPDPATNARGGPRLLQVLGVTRGAAGPVLSYLDAGPDFVPLTAPVVAIVRNGADPLHAVDVTITGVPSGATVALDIGYGASAPSVWPVKITQLNLTAITIPANPANTKIWARAQIRLPNRVSSPWSALASVTLNTLAAPSVVAVVSGTTVTITITPGDATLAIMPVTDRLASGTFHDFLAVALPANSVRFVFSGLDAATRYLVGAQHLDRYGGRSAVGYADITTGGAVTLNAPRHMHFRQARGLREEDPVTDVMIGWGFEVSFRPAEVQSSHLVQLATDAAFTNVVQEITAAPGATDSILFFLPRDTNTTYYVRARATRTGYVDSAWSAIISAKPTALMRNPGPDFFAAGSAELSVNATRQVVIAIDNEGDPDTDAAYYEVVVVDPAIVNVDDPASYPTVDQTDNVVLASAMPFIGLALISGSPVTLPVAKYALATVRFWSNVGGWGQTTLLKFPTRVGAIIPIVYSQRSQAANVATVALVVDDPQGRLLDLRYKSVTGGGDHDFRDPTDGTWEEAPYTLI